MAIEENLGFAPSREIVVENGYEFTGETRQPSAGDLFWNGSSVWRRLTGTGTTARPILRVSGTVTSYGADTEKIEQAYACPSYDI